MKKLLYLIPLIFAVAFLLFPEPADGRGWRGGRGGGGGGGGGGAGTDTGSGGDTGGGSSGGSSGGGAGTETGGGSSDSGGGSPATPGAESTGPTEELGAGNNADAPKDPANAIRDELRLHAELSFRQCAVDRSWDLLWRAYGDGRRLVNSRSAACAQAEQPAEDEAPAADDNSMEKDAPSGDSGK